MHAYPWACMHIFMHNDGDGLWITKGCSSHPQYFMNILSLSVLSFFILTCSALFFPKKGFIFVSLLPEKSWAKGVQTGNGGEKRSQRKKKKLWRIWRKGDWWETSRKGEAVAAAVSEQRWTSLFTHRYLPSCFVHIHMCRLCKVYSWKKRHCNPEETKTKTRLVVVIGKGENGFVIWRGHWR